MAGETPITIVGNLTAEPELRVFTGANNEQVQVVSFSVASSKRVFNRQTGQWDDGTTSFYEVKAFRTLAQHIAASLHKGQQVIVHGTMEQEFWDLKDENNLPTGKKGSKFITTAETVGVSLQFGTAVFQRQSQPQVAQPAAQVAQAPQMAPQPVMQPVAQPVMQPVAQPVMQPVAPTIHAPALQPAQMQPPVAAPNGQPVQF